MADRSETQKISFFEYLYVFVLIIYAGQANKFVLTSSITETPVAVLIPVLLSGILAIRWNIIFNRQFYLLLFGYLIYFILISIKYKEIHPAVLLHYYFLFFVVYTTVMALKFDLFKIYEHLLYILAIIGLLMWVIQIILGGDVLYSFFRNMSSIYSFSGVSRDGVSAILYSVQPSSESMLYGYLVPRNCGFAWEPGGFAVYLCLAIFINLFFSKSDSIGKRRILILVLALLSTQSTTGYVIFILIIFYHYLNMNIKMVLLLLPVMIIGIIFLFSLRFMNNKLEELVNETHEIEYMVKQTIGRETGYAPQRFSSFLIDMRDFYNNPILGLGGHDEDSWTYKIGANIHPISGIGYIFAQFGLVGFLFFMIISYKSSLFFSEYFNFKGRFLLFFIIMLISISYGIILYSLIMSFWMFSFFNSQKVP